MRFLLLLTLITAPSAALAQDYKPAEPGSFKLTPKLTLQTSYNDNIYADDSNEQSDFITSIRPELGITKYIRDHMFKLSLKGNAERFKNETSENTEEGSADLSARLIARRAWQIPLGFSYDIDHINRDTNRSVSRPNAPTKTKTKSAYLGLNYDGQRKFFGSVTGKFEDKEFEDGTTFGTNTATIRSDNNYDRREIILKAGLKPAPFYKPYIELAAGNKDFKKLRYTGTGFNGVDRSHNFKRALFGLSLDYKKLITGDIAFGQSWRDYDDVSLSNDSTTAARMNISWTPLERLKVIADFSRKFEDDNSVNSSIVRSQAGLNTTYELNENWVASAGITAAHEKFENTARKDKRYDAAAGIDYRINESLSLGLNYNFTTRDSSASALDFEQSAFIFTITGEL